MNFRSVFYFARTEILLLNITTSFVLIEATISHLIKLIPLDPEALETTQLHLDKLSAMKKATVEKVKSNIIVNKFDSLI